MLALKSSWPEPSNRGGDLACEGSDEASARDASDYAVADPEAPARHALGRGEHDADDEPGLDDLAKNDQKRGKHSSLSLSLLRDQGSLGLVLVKIVKEAVGAALQAARYRG